MSETHSSLEDVIKSKPEDWEEMRLGDLFKQRKEKNRPDLPLLAVTGAGGVVPRDSLERRDTSNADKSKYLRVCEGDIAYNTMRMWQGVSGLSAHEGIVSPAYTICQPVNGVSSGYMSQLFKLPELIQVFHRNSQGLVDDTLNLKFENFSPIRIPVPPLPEQQKIAAILSSVDDVIEKTRAQIDKLKDLKTGMMQELLTKGIGHTAFKDSPVGRIPKGWDVANLIELSLNGISNGVFNDPKKVGKGKRLINVFDMYQGFGINPFSLKLLDVDENEFNKNKVEYGDIFFTRSSLKLEGIAYCNINLSRNDDITYDGHLMRIRPDQARVAPKYLAYYCLSYYARKFFMAAAKHSTMTTIGQADIAPLNVTVPPLQEQIKIVEILDSVQGKIQAYQSKLSQLNSAKKALMQDLLTGKVRVKVENTN